MKKLSYVYVYNVLEPGQSGLRGAMALFRGDPEGWCRKKFLPMGTTLKSTFHGCLFVCFLFLVGGVGKMSYTEVRV